MIGDEIGWELITHHLKLGENQTEGVVLGKKIPLRMAENPPPPHKT